MSWQDETTEILRILINDFSDDPTYSDETIEQLVLVAAKYVKQELQLGTDYTIDFLDGSITPDPSDDATFLNMSVLKAACLTNQWAFNQKAIADGITARLGPANLTVKGAGDVILGLIKEGPCKTYEQLKIEYNFGRVGGIKAIMTPFISNTYLPDSDGHIR